MAHSQILLLVALCLLAPIASTAATYDGCGVAVYWGQNLEETSLTETCQSGIYRYVSLAFLDIKGTNPEDAILNLVHCDPYTGSCASLGNEIRYCRSQGIKVLLSITGGDPNSQAGLASGMVRYLTNTFLKPSGSNSGPFDGAALDGFVFSLTKGSGTYNLFLALGLKLNGAFLTASPDCSITHTPLASAMKAGVFQQIWVKFYNNPTCDYSLGIDGVVLSWNQWLLATSNSSMLFLNLPASTDAATSGFIPYSDLAYEILPRIRYGTRYGGVALWNRYYDIQSNYGSEINPSVCDYRGHWKNKKDSLISQVVG